MEDFFLACVDEARRDMNKRKSVLLLRFSLLEHSALAGLTTFRLLNGAFGEIFSVEIRV